MKNRIDVRPLSLILRSCLALGFCCVLTGSVLAQNSVVVFHDDFERGTPGLTPGVNDPLVGSYALTGTVNPTNEVRILTGPYLGGPNGAANGNNYLMIDRINNQSANQVLNALFTHSFFATNTPFHAELRLWATRPAGDNNWPQFVLGGAIVNGVSSGPTATLHLLYSSAVMRELAWKWYNGSVYNDSGLRFSDGAWDLVELDWDGKIMTGKINGVAATLGTWGTTDKILDRLLLRTGTAPTIFFVDDVKVVATAPILLRSVQPAPNATGVGRAPIVQVQLVDVSQNVDTNSIQLFIDSVQVTPSITQAIIGDALVTTVSFVAPVLAYGSMHTSRIVYSDQASPANQYGKEWRWTVYANDLIFADTFETSVPHISPFHASAYEGTKSLSFARIGAGRPILVAAGDPTQPSNDGDLIQLSFAFAPWSSAWQNGVLAVIPGYATETNTFEQTGQINLTADGRVSVIDLTGAVNQYLTARMTTNAWNTIVINYVNGSAQWNVSINGFPAETFFGKSNQGGSAYGNVNGFRLATAGNGWTWSDAYVISNLTTQALLFRDGFEDVPEGAIPGTESPAVGTYMTIDPGTVAGGMLVTDGVNGETWIPAPPNSPQVGSYNPSATTATVWNGTGQAGTKFVNLTNGTVTAEFLTPIPSGIRLRAEAWFNWQAGTVSWGLFAPGTPNFARVTVPPDNSITFYDGSSEVTTGLTRTNGGWQRCDLDYVVGSSQITVSWRGIPVTLPIAPASSIKGLYFVANDGGRAYVDSVRATALLGEIPATNPQLTATVSGSQMTLSWAGGTGYYLQFNSDVANPNSWTIVPGGGASPVTIPVSAVAPGFYRLVKPL